MPNPTRIAVNAYIQAKAAAGKGDHPAAIEAYRQALRHGLDDATVWFELAFAYMSLHRNKEALECWEKSIERDPSNAVAINNKADSLLHLGRFDEAIGAAKQAVVMGAMEGWHTLAEIYEATGQVDKAIEALDSFISQGSSGYDEIKPQAKQKIEELRRNTGGTSRPAELPHFVVKGKERPDPILQWDGEGLGSGSGDARRNARMKRLLELKKI